MREAIGNTFVFNIIVTFVIIFIIIFAGSSSYSKAAKVKNTILDILVQNSDTMKGTDDRLPASVVNKIDGELKAIGYRVNPERKQNCKRPTEDRNAKLMNPTSNYHYCVWRIPAERGYYYHVTAYLYFEFPIVSVIEYPITGESRVIYGEVEYKY
ncbi:MAG: hypothetical protein KH135_02775 [Firmicutes bacterium]|nr:hypothetical protein [Bacillota bacterium]